MKLTALKVDRTTKPGLHGDGDGLYLQVTPVGTKSWIFRFTLNGKTRSMGLGSVKAISLKRARELAAEPRRLRAEGVDPLEAKRARRAATAVEVAKLVTFKQCAENYVAAHEHTWRSEPHRRQWRSSLERLVYPVIGSLPARDIDTPLVLRVLQPIWNEKPESASRVRGRIETVLNAAKAGGLRSGENPAAWGGHLENLLPAPRKLRQVEHLAALPYPEVCTFMQSLRSRQGFGARALEFAILTAARKGEVISATWSEINFDERTWTIPSSRMKAGKEHRVPLSDAATVILRPLHAVRSNEFVFPGLTGRRLSASAMPSLLRLMKRTDLTVHGFRSTFKDWASEQTSFANEVVEMALAHTVGSAVERAYRRGDLFDRRRQLMDAWARYCEQPVATGEVVAIRK
jgi:integrase